MKRGKALFEFDLKLRSEHVCSRETFTLVGIDEAGRGPWAGPVVACAVSLHSDYFDPHLNDSKLLSAKARDSVYARLIKTAVFGLGIIEVEHIDSLNILNATHRAMKAALENLLSRLPEAQPDLVVIDGRPVPAMGFAQKAIVRGDLKSAAIAAAGVIAKVTRDRLMCELHEIYPQYGFASHKGYGTRLHQQRLKQHGPSPIHRKSFAPVRELLEAGRLN